MLGLGVLLDEPEDQLALAARVAGVDDVAHVLALGQLDDGIEPRLGFVHRLQVKVGRQHRQIGKAPLAALDVKLFRRLNLDQVANRRRNQPVVTFKILVVFFKLAGGRRDGAHDVLRNGWLFCDDESFHIHMYFFKPSISSGNISPPSAKTTLPSRRLALSSFSTTTTGRPLGFGSILATSPTSMAAGKL